MTEMAKGNSAVPLVKSSKGCTIADEANGFDKLSHKVMLWILWHLWPKGCRYAFNCNNHEAMLIICNLDHSPIIMWSLNGVTQDDMMVIVIYGIAQVPCVEILWMAFPEIVQQWYVDDLSPMENMMPTSSD